MGETKTTEFTFVFGPQCHNWTNFEDSNLLYLKSITRFWNQRLGAHGYLFLNDVLDDLGLGRIRAGQAVGWFGQERGYDKVKLEISPGEQLGTLILKFVTEGNILHVLPES